MLHLNCYLIAFSPMVGGLIAGFLGKKLGKTITHCVAILGVLISCIYSLELAYGFYHDHHTPFEMVLYNWGKVGQLTFQVGFYIDELTALMCAVVTFVSLMVHIYTIGYMHEDEGYTRFFSYIAMFTFSMLMLVMSNNCLQLFFGWEAVGVISYLLIGFWYQRETAIFANLKAFLVNRVGDFGFLLGLGVILMFFGTFNYVEIFKALPEVLEKSPTLQLIGGESWSAITVACILLFIGAMGKSAQVPLHVWLPDSMEGPTPISALIHAATMVTAGVFMVSRFSPLFEHSEVALNFVLFIGTITCVFMGLLGIVQNDIKRIIAYSTLSQLGYMMVALGVSAYSVGVFHLMTHAFFKALLFLGAGSVIMGMHHEQDIWKMGGLYKHMPITYVCMFIGSLALIGFPLFSGFYSKDLIIMAAQHSTLPFAEWAYYGVLGSVFVTAFYSFRLFFVVFHTKERMDKETKSHLHESPWVVWLPLVLLAVPSVISGYWFVGDVLGGYFGTSIDVSQHNVVSILKEEYAFGQAGGSSPQMHMAAHGLTSLPFILAMSGVISAWICYVLCPSIPHTVSKGFKWIHQLMLHKYGFDTFNEKVLAKGVRGLGMLSFKADQSVIDAVSNGAASQSASLAGLFKKIQTGYIYHYALALFLGLIGCLVWFLLRANA